MVRSSLHRYVILIAAGLAVLTSATTTTTTKHATTTTTTTPATTTTPTTTTDATVTYAATNTPTTSTTTTTTTTTTPTTTAKGKVTAEGVLEEVSEMLKKLREVTRTLKEARQEHDRLRAAVAEVTKAVKDMGEHNQHIKKKVRKMSKGMKKNSHNKKIKDGIKSLQRDHQRILHAMSLSGINVTRLHNNNNNHTKKHNNNNNNSNNNQTKNNHNKKRKNHTTTTIPTTTTTTTSPLKEALTKKDKNKDNDDDDDTLGSTDNLIHEPVVDPPSPNDPPLPADCREVMQRGNYESGVYLVQPQGLQQPIKVWCDHTTSGGGWTVLLARLEQDDQQDFSKGWAEYKKGIGDPSAEHWLGLDALHVMTKGRNNELRVNITDWNDTSTWAVWKEFRVGPEDNKYKLTIGRYTSDSHAGDALKWHNGMKFSTPDKDNDALLGGHCARKNDGGWWYRGYRGCYHAHPTGRYQHNPGDSPQTSVTSRNFDLGPVLVWQNWRGESYYPKTLFLMFRPLPN